jgi:thiosulfate/3-mercaptopyruvate sulfurtransferase
MHTTLITAADLVPHIADPAWLLIDCRFDLSDPAAGEKLYRRDHIPNAIYASLDRDLSGPLVAGTGRHPLPSPNAFAETLSRWGISEQMQVIAYDADNSAYAARLWWMLRWVGHHAVAVLDGGYNAWRAAALPVSGDVPRRDSTHFIARPQRAAWLDAAEVQQRVARSDWRLLDARGPERFAGEVEPIDPVAGHVAGAHNHPFVRNLSADGRFLPADELRARFAATQNGVGDEHTIAMCGSGVTACHLLLGLEIAGKSGARLYPGSWSEWITDPSRPIATRVDG